MKTCPIGACRRRIADRSFTCPTHWHALAPELKDSASANHGAYVREDISFEEYRRENGRLARLAGGRGAGSLFPPCRWRECACGVSVLEASDGGTRVFLEEWENGLYVVRGGFVAVEDSAGGAYARFVRHHCRVATVVRDGGQNDKGKSDGVCHARL